MPGDVLGELKWRGLVHQVTDPQLGERLKKESLAVYCGFDPSADSLHLGNLMGLINLARFQKAGHKAIAIAGGGTGFIGDPSGKSAERSLLTAEQLDANCRGIQEVISRIFRNAGAGEARLINNADWLCKLSLIEFLRDTGKHFTVNHMVAKDSVKSRMDDREHGISFTEFSYMLLQAYDFWHLFKTFGCRMQIGGSDQWGNITAGCDLIRRRIFVDTIQAASKSRSVLPHELAEKAEKAAKVIENYTSNQIDKVLKEGITQGEFKVVAAFSQPAYGLTWPLLVRSDGKKFGKTEDGAVWLSAHRTSPYALYQYFINVPDADAGTMLRWFTELPQAEIEALEARHAAEPAKREAQRALARELTRLVHGEDETRKAEQAAAALFGGGAKDGDAGLAGLDEATLLELVKEAPNGPLAKARLNGEGALFIDLMAESGLWKSKGEAKRAIQQGGANLNNVRVSDLGKKVNSGELLHGKYLVLRKGKKEYFLFKAE
ncbi:MAG: tyrosine--tRNA ligase [Planctomycetota bacterium]|nr:tyrosine--tRNA ligase [Planctomycetota bacterium]